jgi:hypothetical protein
VSTTTPLSAGWLKLWSNSVVEIVTAPSSGAGVGGSCWMPRTVSWSGVPDWVSALNWLPRARWWSVASRGRGRALEVVVVDHATFLVVDGEVLLETANDRVELGPGQLYTVPAGLAHVTSPITARSVNITFEKNGMSTERLGAPARHPEASR